MGFSEEKYNKELPKGSNLELQQNQDKEKIAALGKSALEQLSLLLPKKSDILGYKTGADKLPNIPKNVILDISNFYKTFSNPHEFSEFLGTKNILGRNWGMKKDGTLILSNDKSDWSLHMSLGANGDQKWVCDYKDLLRTMADAECEEKGKMLEEYFNDKLNEQFVARGNEKYGKDPKVTVSYENKCFTIINNFDGEMKVTTRKGEITIKKGESIDLPASPNFKPNPLTIVCESYRTKDQFGRDLPITLFFNFPFEDSLE